MAKFESDRTVRNVKKKKNEFFDQKSEFFKTDFDNALTPFLQDVSVAETIVKWCTYFQITVFQCFKNYGGLTRGTRFKVASTIVDAISMKHSISSLNVRDLPVLPKL